ncbi:MULTISPECIES: SDR family NAD(P)-dependent oxidoreductase [Chelativorans]|jgi:NAD(P)-dependent dehydrogenase (short-subunit alcohol dehydrogenase family)|uniref:Short-chain dehydrogenase/reductase SDR n=1 Tax=Chelativorans sp. (strain BNC1) TaxID=266779 RepID=Q11E37_CHESB|nr:MULTISPECIES: SDR family oxidoreductase [Chelativorans]
MRLANKIAFITGAAEGIGACAAGLFSREGAKVILSDIDEDRGRKVADQVTSAGGDAVFVRCDVTSEASVREAAAAVQERYGALHILYNNVGGSTPRDDRVTDVDLEEFWSAMKLNVLSVVLPARHLIPLIAASGGGSVINTASYMALLGTAGRDCYTASKGAVVSLTRSMAVEFGPDNIRVNVIGPGAVDTERLRRFQSARPDHPTFDPRNRHRRPEVASHIMGLVQPEDVANMALFLASDESVRITGSLHMVDSGASCW